MHNGEAAHKTDGVVIGMCIPIVLPYTGTRITVQGSIGPYIDTNEHTHTHIHAKLQRYVQVTSDQQRQSRIEPSGCRSPLCLLMLMKTSQTRSLAAYPFVFREEVYEKGAEAGPCGEVISMAGASDRRCGRAIHSDKDE